MRPVIRVENLSKRYRLGETHSGTLRDMLQGAASRLFGRRAQRQALDFPASRSGTGRIDEQGAFWALRSMSFEIHPGEVIGFIGKNGAGKSTLLKILSRIAPPTSGRIEIRGRIASLLEVGTGFHPELTGRENVYLNGAILGMTKAEIRDRFDQIVDFAGITDFIETPVKRYSSGMYVRLAFAVAAHLDPEILIVDEVLAVGDVEFQKKCLGKLAETSESGRTVLFVSHNMTAIRRLCSRCLVLRNGIVSLDGPTPVTIDHYLSGEASATGAVSWAGGLANSADSEFCFEGVRLLNERLQPETAFHTQQDLCVEISFRVRQALRNCRVGFVVSTADGTAVFEVYDTDDAPENWVRQPGTGCVTCRLPLAQLLPGRYVISLNAGIPHVRNLAQAEGALAFELHEAPSPQLTVHVPRQGVMRPTAAWTRNSPA